MYVLYLFSCTDVKTKMYTKETSSLQIEIQKKNQEMKTQGTLFSFCHDCLTSPTLHMW